VIPLRDSIPSRSFPVVTIALIATNVVVFVHQVTLGPDRGQAFVAAFGAVPAQITHASAHAVGTIAEPLTLVTSMFLHGGLMHLLGNMVFLWIFGNNVEDATGHVRFLVFYLICGLVGALAHVAANPGSTVPMVGASGAISGVLGAYFLLYPFARIVTLVFFGFFAQTVNIPAFFFLGFWFFMQALSGAASVGGRGGGVAFLAHVGGFVSGLSLVAVFKRRQVRLWNRITG
jgi:membrane associated rhomboid family serine protease